MNCHKIREELLNILLFTSHFDLSPALQSHLMECPSCREWWEKERILEEWLMANLQIQPVFLKVPVRARKSGPAFLSLIFNLLGIYYVGFLALIFLFLPFIPFFFRLLISIPILLPPWWAIMPYLFILVFSLWILALFSAISLTKKYIFAGVKIQ
ncbi:MAG: hypothetical protein ACK4G3_03780 [bacterium]